MQIYSCNGSLKVSPTSTQVPKLVPMLPLKLLWCFVNAVYKAFFESHCLGFSLRFCFSDIVQEWADSSAHGQLSPTLR